VTSAYEISRDLTCDDNVRDPISSTSREISRDVTGSPYRARTCEISAYNEISRDLACDVSVRDLVDLHPCQRDFVSYLEAGYICVEGMGVFRCSVSDDGVSRMLVCRTLEIVLL